MWLIALLTTAILGQPIIENHANDPDMEMFLNPESLVINVCRWKAYDYAQGQDTALIDWQEVPVSQIPVWEDPPGDGYEIDLSSLVGSNLEVVVIAQCANAAGWGPLVAKSRSFPVTTPPLAPILEE